MSYVPSYAYCTSVKWLEQAGIFASTRFSSAQSSFIQKLKLDFCDNICRVGLKSKTWEVPNYLKKKSSVSLKKDFISQVHLYFSASFSFYFSASFLFFLFITMPRTFSRNKLVFHWRKIWYPKLTYIFPLVLLFSSKFPIHNIKLGQWFLLTLKC